MLDIHVVFVQVIRSLKRALQPSITDISVDFMVPKEVKIIQSPKNLPPVFNGEKLVVYATLKAQKALDKKVQCTATLKGNMLGATVEYQVPFVLDSSAAAPSLPVIHHLAAKALITDWETEEKEKKSIVDLSIESSVISSHTAFIAIDEESSEPVSGSMKTYDIHPASYPFGALYQMMVASAMDLFQQLQNLLHQCLMVQQCHHPHLVHLHPHLALRQIIGVHVKERHLNRLSTDLFNSDVWTFFPLHIIMHLVLVLRHHHYKVVHLVALHLH